MDHYILGEHKHEQLFLQLTLYKKILLYKVVFFSCHTTGNREEVATAYTQTQNGLECVCARFAEATFFQRSQTQPVGYNYTGRPYSL